MKRRILPDHCVPRPFGKALGEFEISTAQQEGWSALDNGQLIDAAEKARFDVLVTADKNLRYQQHLASRRIAIVELPTNRLRLLAAYQVEAARAVGTVPPGGYVAIPF